MNVRHYIDFFAYKAFRSSYHHESIGFNYKEVKSLQSSRQGNKEGGFTLIELMIVIAIIGILAAVAVPNFISYRDKAYCSAVEKDVRTIMGTLSDYFAVPSHTTLPIPISLPTTSGYFTTISLSGSNTASITGSVSNICVTVRDGSSRCPDDYGRAGSPHWIKVDGIWYMKKCSGY
ncbi:MAG: type II secretion system protein [Candidatus Electrothrix sp. AW1]|nr:type II secretion system protein [Candidatus Electrothrix sp. AX1]MCI5182709.1 type II secretion system protein [Candidatus Electrothrix gigas]